MPVICLQISAHPPGLVLIVARRWYYQYVENDFEFELSLRGCHPKAASWLADPDHRILARQFVRERNKEKGKPKMKSYEFRMWINDQIKSEMKGADEADVEKALLKDDSTAIRYLHSLGFKVTRTGKQSTYIDGHERPDVVNYRRKFVRYMYNLSWRAVHSIISASEKVLNLSKPMDERPLIFIYHDEVVYYSNETESWAWMEEGDTLLHSKGLGKALMYSGFVTEFGPLEDEQGNSCGEWLEIGNGNTWNGDRMRAQFTKAVCFCSSVYVCVRENVPAHRWIHLKRTILGHKRSSCLTELPVMS